MLKTVFKRGLLTVLPICITILIVVWLFKLVEGFFSSIYLSIFGPRYYFPGLGIIIAVIVILVVGLLMSNFVMQKIYSWFDKLLNKMPIVKTLYRSIDDLAAFFKQDKSSKMGPVVVVNWHGTKLLGLVSREAFNDLPQGIGNEGEVAVYIPFGYQIGGMTVIVPQSMVSKIEMSFEDGLRFAATAGMPSAQKEVPKKGDGNEKPSH